MRRVIRMENLHRVTKLVAKEKLDPNSFNDN